MHGVYVDEGKKSITFDVIIDYQAKNRKALYASLEDSVQEMYPDYSVHIAMDSDISD